MTGTLRRTPTDKLLDDLGWERLKTRRIIHRLLFFHRIHFNSPPLPDYITAITTTTRQNDTGLTLRNAATLSIPRNRLSSFQNSYIPNTTRLWNTLPDSHRNTLSRPIFRKLTWEKFGNKKPPPFYSSGSKFGNIHHTRLRVGMSTLNAHLFSINHPKAPSPACSCGSNFEDTKHFILHCPLFTQSRLTLLNATRPLVPNFDNLPDPDKINIFLFCSHVEDVNKLQITHLFQKFVLSTHRFT